MNLSSLNTSTPTTGGLNLTKAQSLDLTKAAPTLTRAILGGGWDVATNGPTADLDIAAFLLNANGRVSNIATDVVYFGQMNQQGIRLEGDNRTGVGDGDDERIQIELNNIRSDVHKIVFVITIYDAKNKKQTFGMIKNSYVRLLDVDQNEREICRYNLTEKFATETAVIVAELQRNGSGWNFNAVGEGVIGDLNDILSRYQ